ncbi:MAG: hypothetical protein ACRD8U_10105 [Pyrinomonadaceae bacterium]
MARLPPDSISHTWGTTLEERQLSYPCDALVPHPDASLYRGIDIQATAEIIFRWLCQMRVAPYSYDWIDNLGRRSPDKLTPGLDQLAVGQDVMTIFDLAAFVPNQHLTIRIKPGTRAYRVFGDIASTYLLVPKDKNSCRLLVKLVVKYTREGPSLMMRNFLPWGDLFMMRRQLLNFKRLAEAVVISAALSADPTVRATDYSCSKCPAPISKCLPGVSR